LRTRIEQLEKVPWKMIVADEGFFKNSESQTFLALKRLTDKTQRLVLLNATSLEINLTEVYSHLELVAPGLIGFEEFKRRFCKVEIKYIRTKYKTTIAKEKIIGAKSLEALEELKTFMSSFYIKRAYKDVGVQLPEKIIKNIEVEILPSQKKEYLEQIKKYKNKELKGAQLLYNLLRVCDGKLVDFEKQTNPEETSAKGEAFISLVNSIGQQQIVVYSTYIAPLLAFAKIAKNMGKRVGFYTGQNDTTREKHLEEFKKGERDILFLTQAGQRGINIETCAHLIMINQLYNNSATIQLHGRISRITSKHKNIFIYNLLTMDTVEEAVQELLVQRGVISEYINEDGSVKTLTDNQINLLLKPRKSLIDDAGLQNSVDSFEM
jgi:SNF2 family DNA or RNA helicase